MSDPVSREIHEEMLGELEGEIEQLEFENDILKERLDWMETELRTLELRCIRLEVDSNES